MNVRVVSGISCCAVIGAIAGVLAQAPSPAPVFRSVARLVEVSVVVHDAKGAVVENVRPDEFELFDNGVKQDISSVRVERIEPVTGSAKPAPLPDHVFSNAAPYRAGTPKATTIILLDQLNTPPVDQVFARQQLVKFLRTLTPADSIALYTLGRDLRVVHDFTTDISALLRALQKRGLYAGPELADSTPEAADTGSNYPEMDALLNGVAENIAAQQTVDRVRTTLAAIEAIARHVSGLPGRKNLVWVSGGFPLSIGMEQISMGTPANGVEFSTDLENAARTISAAQLAIYPIDARGLQAGSQPSVSAAPNSRTAAPAAALLTPRMSSVVSSQQAMISLAQRTGGRPFVNTNDLRGAIRKATDDARTTYVLGYYPAHGTWDGKFRRLKVNVKRPGLDVRYRTGYFAFGDRQQTAEARKAALSEAARSPIEATGIALVARLDPDQPKPGSLRVQLAIEPRHVSLVRQGDRWVGEVDVMFVSRATADAVPAVTSQFYPISLTQEDRESALEAALRLTRTLDLVQARYALQIVVRDPATGRVGSVSVRTETLK